MKQKTSIFNLDEIYLPRRQFVKGVAMGGALLGLGFSPSRLLAATGSTSRQPSLSGTNFNLNLAPQAVNYTGHERIATAVNGSVPGPILRWREGDNVTLNVTNQMMETSSIHWHGIILPPEMDGVPDISFNGIAPGETFRYQFDLKQSGTYWYHSHSGFQEQTGLYGSIIVEPREPEPFSYDRIMSSCSQTGPMKTRTAFIRNLKNPVGTTILLSAQQAIYPETSSRKVWPAPGPSVACGIICA